MNFIEKHGRLIDLIGAAFFFILAAVAALQDLRIFVVGFAFGFVAFCLSFMAWDGPRLDRPTVFLCRIFAVLSLVALVIAFAVWVLA